MSLNVNWGEIEKQFSSPGFQSEIKISEELRKHTSFLIGGPADIFLIPFSKKELIKIIRRFSEKNLPYRILGSGTNLLVSDEGVGGAVIKIGLPLNKFSFQGNMLLVESGASLSALAQAAARKGLGGLEFAVGIPGTVGGAVVMNAGCQGQEISRVVRKVQIFHPEYRIDTLKQEDCQFAYRHSRFLTTGEIVLEVELELEPDSGRAVKERLKKRLVQKEAKFPLEFPSAGSVFKNPPNDYAGRLIEAAGLKGMRIGDAQISEKHANWIINRGDAKFAEVGELIQISQEEVKRKFGIDLELEIEIWK